MKYGRQQTGTLESERGHKKNAARNPIGIKVLAIINKTLKKKFSSSSPLALRRSE